MAFRCLDVLTIGTLMIVFGEAYVTGFIDISKGCCKFGYLHDINILDYLDFARPGGFHVQALNNPPEADSWKPSDRPKGENKMVVFH